MVLTMGKGTGRNFYHFLKTTVDIVIKGLSLKCGQIVS